VRTASGRLFTGMVMGSPPISRHIDSGVGPSAKVRHNSRLHPSETASPSTPLMFPRRPSAACAKMIGLVAGDDRVSVV
jgi:hypothetical protein